MAKKTFVIEIEDDCSLPVVLAKTINDVKYVSDSACGRLLKELIEDIIKDEGNLKLKAFYQRVPVVE